MLSQEVYSDLLSFTFDGPKPYNQNQPLFIDAEDPSRSFTAVQFRQLVRTLIAGLKAHNVQPGDCVLLHLGNSILYPALFFGIIGAGGVYMGSNPRSHSQELDHIISLAEPKLILTTHEALPAVLDVSAARGMHPAQVCLVDERSIDHCAKLFLWQEHGYSSTGEIRAVNVGNRHNHFANLIRYGESDWLKFSDPVVAQATPAAMYPTSGTGGLPKAAILSHHALVSQHRIIYYDVPHPVSRLISLPMFHLFGALWTHLFPVRYGHPLFVMARFEINDFLAAVHKYQITETYLVPAVIHSINQSTVPIGEMLSSLRYVGVAGAPIDGHSMQQFRSYINPMGYAGQIWGMTEVGVTFQTRWGQQGDPGSIGTCLAGYEARLVKSDGEIVRGDCYSGELYVRGPGLLSAYKGRTDALEHGWFRTGDVAYVKQGQYYIVGRTKELIKVRGWQVAPAEIEHVLLQHPGILDAAVIGVNTDGVGEVPRAFIVRSRDPSIHRLTGQEVYNYARLQLATYKALDGGVVFVEEIPRTASGKIQRFRLSQMNSYREMVASLLSRFDGDGSALATAARHELPAAAERTHVSIIPEGRVAV
ncbi:Adenylate-forming enzyme AfeA [Penicillium digitatum]|uniref:Adenylate-forming enzyme AfeA n=3 Tax=Penicillium digitatum TaxID=36651 RepID=K9G0S5_PEND2|nr:Adenylate-forming enzyme AfeA [Penicillium digitatum Pd1]EKV10638.1 Adenylate-forming enzyme AfeA [Penicillium digitatum Pd1]EKV15580.1 Adenylate-forming enzyme AfeA [Penicillium digitatum PHI26]QQK44094.1 Adenylate-forming enzyme AfeA [Penicillium digitatum]